MTHCPLVSSPNSWSLSQRQQCGLISSGPRVEGSPAPGSSWKLELKDSSLLVSPTHAKCICKQAFSVALCSYSQGIKRERNKLESGQPVAYKGELSQARPGLKDGPWVWQACAPGPVPRALDRFAIAQDCYPMPAAGTPRGMGPVSHCCRSHCFTSWRRERAYWGGDAWMLGCCA